MKLIELFAGIGTQRKAFESNFSFCETIGISEIDSKPLKIYQNLFSTLNNFGDITKFNSCLLQIFGLILFLAQTYLSQETKPDYLEKNLP